ncbi:MAG: P-type conjugative transfer protein TrbL, partial [Methylocystaceae bacterium]|nr:P-type conjugative transfer protein TrbL [Methylocystaceae bacterium]
LSAGEFLQPGRIAQVGIDAGRPLLNAISDLMGYVSFFENFAQIIILLFAWAVVCLAFFILAIQLFVTLIEFKLTTLAGFILIPFGLFGKTAFAAERVLGNVFSSGVKVLVLAVVVGIGSTLFSQFTTGFGAAQPTVDDALTIVLASLSLLGLGIFGPAIANGIVSGGPQLAAGSAIGSNLAAGGMIAASAGITAAGGSSLSNATATLATKGAYAAGVTSGAYRSDGISGVAGAALNAMNSPLRSVAANLQSNFSSGLGMTGAQASSSGASTNDSTPDWARRMRRNQLISNGASQTVHAIKSGQEGGSGASINLSEEK